MKILAVDASTEACSVAILDENECQERFEFAPRKHTELILPMVDELLSATGLTLSQLDALAYDKGPGSFTGVRVGTSVIQGLAYSTKLPVIGVSSLAALAQLAYRTHQYENVIAMIDARMDEVYWARYQYSDGGMVLMHSELVSKPEKIRAADQWACIGSGWDRYQDELSQNSAVNINASVANSFPHAQDIAVLAATMFKDGQTVGAEKALPTYIRNEVTWKKLSEQ